MKKEKISETFKTINKTKKKKILKLVILFFLTILLGFGVLDKPSFIISESYKSLFNKLELYKKTDIDNVLILKFDDKTKKMLYQKYGNRNVSRNLGHFYSLN